jgi:hypothetical protein
MGGVMFKETYSRIIDKYFSSQVEKNIIDDDLTDEQLEDLIAIYGIDVKPGDEIYRYFIKSGDTYTTKYLSSSYKSDAMKSILLTDKVFIEDRGGIPVFG